jgi:hypothetical protein
VVVAEVSAPLAGGGAAAPPVGLGSGPSPEELAQALAALVLLAAAAGLLVRAGPVAPWQRALAAGLCAALVFSPALPVLANLPGDVREDGRLDAADALLLLRALRSGRRPRISARISWRVWSTGGHRASLGDSRSRTRSPDQLHFH